MNNKLHYGTSGREGCNGCSRVIPKDIQRTSFSYSSRWGTKYIRLCAVCINQLNSQISKNKAFNDMIQRNIEEEI